MAIRYRHELIYEGAAHPGQVIVYSKPVNFELGEIMMSVYNPITERSTTWKLTPRFKVSR